MDRFLLEEGLPNLSSSHLAINMKDEIVEFLEEKGWVQKEIIDPTLLKRLCHK